MNMGTFIDIVSGSKSKLNNFLMGIHGFIVYLNVKMQGHYNTNTPWETHG